ncbi:MAG: PorV/PorQ family protein [Bacteroidia bacterium]
MYKTSLTLLILLWSYQIFAQAPKYSNEFLSIGLGARAQAMGGAHVGIVDDVTAAYWNPAGLVQKQGDLQLGLQHAELFAGISKYDYAGLAAPVDATRVIGFSIIRFAVDDIIDSTDLIDADGNIDYNRLKSFSAADYAFLFTYSKKTKIEGFRYGGNFKVIHRKVGDFASAWGFGLDAGLQYDKNKWKFGVMAKDVTSTFNAWHFNTDQFADVFAQTGNEIPQDGLEITLPKLIPGAAYKFNAGKKFTVLAELDADITFDGKRNVLIKSDPMSIDPRFGLEFGWDNFIFLRGGLNNIQQVTEIDNSTTTTVQPNFGLGVKIKNVSIDYALTNLGSGAGIPYSNVFSLRLNINRHKEEVKTTN